MQTLTRLGRRAEAVAFDLLPVPVLVWIWRRRCSHNRKQRRREAQRVTPGR